MYIVNMAGVILVSFDKWDVRSVAKAERWISYNHYVIWKFETTILGKVIVTVKEAI